MRDIQHLTFAETAHALQISESTVKTRLLRSRLQRRDTLASGVTGHGAKEKRGPLTLPIIEISCVEVWRELSNYIDGNVDPELRQRIKEHLKECEHCTAVLDGTRNVIRLVGDGPSFDLPPEFSDRLKKRLQEKLRS